MGLSIQNNLMALGASRNLAATYGALSKSIGKLSSGLRISGAADDAAGLAVRELMRSDIVVLNQGVRNANNAISLLQTMDGAASVIDEKLIRMKELAEQAATGTYSSAQRAIMHDEFNEMRLEIERIAQATEFNEVSLMRGRAEASSATSTILSLTAGNNLAADDTYTFVSAFDTLGIDTTAAVAEVKEVAVINAEAGFTGTSDTFMSAFSDIGVGSGETIGLEWADQDGAQSAATITINSATTVANVTTSINAITSGEVIVTYTSGTGFTVTDVTSGDSVMYLDLVDMGDMSTYRSSATTEGVDSAAATTDTFVASWTDQDGDVANANISVTHGDDIAAVMTRLNAAALSASMEITFVTPTAPANDYFRIAAVSAGVSELGLTFNDEVGTAVEYTASEVSAGVDAVTSAGNDVTIHFGTGNDATKDYYDIEAQDLTKEGLGVSALSITTQASAQAALETLDAAILSKDEARAHFGAMINRLENTVTNITVQAENIQAAESQISDVDVATEMTTFVNLQIKAQAASAMLAQANMMPQMALTLLGGA